MEKGYFLFNDFQRKEELVISTYYQRLISYLILFFLLCFWITVLIVPAVYSSSGPFSPDDFSYPTDLKPTYYPTPQVVVPYGTSDAGTVTLPTIEVDSVQLTALKIAYHSISEVVSHTLEQIKIYAPIGWEQGFKWFAAFVIQPTTYHFHVLYNSRIDSLAYWHAFFNLTLMLSTIVLSTIVARQIGGQYVASSMLWNSLQYGRFSIGILPVTTTTTSRLISSSWIGVWIRGKLPIREAFASRFWKGRKSKTSVINASSVMRVRPQQLGVIRNPLTGNQPRSLQSKPGTIRYVQVNKYLKNKLLEGKGYRGGGGFSFRGEFRQQIDAPRSSPPASANRGNTSSSSSSGSRSTSGSIRGNKFQLPKNYKEYIKAVENMGPIYRITRERLKLPSSSSSQGTKGKGETRPTWKQSEKDVAKEYPGYKEQQSFKGGESVQHGTRGSSRPDLYIKGHSIEVKNYNVTTTSDRSNLVNNVSNQVNKRVSDLPIGTKQTVIIDVRGQNVSRQILREIKLAINNKTNGIANIIFKQ